MHPFSWSVVKVSFYSRGFCFAVRLQFARHFVLKQFLLMETKIGQVHWLGEEDYLCCQGGLFLDSSPMEFSANGSLFAHAHWHMPMRMPKEFHHHLTKTADACKNRHTNVSF